MRKPARYFSLQRPKLRLSWNKHNLYNLARKVGADRSLQDRPTFFQMKWAAKASTRAYHGEHIAEKKWKRMFSHRLMSAVDLPPKYLAENDGSEQAAGRGSGTSTNQISAEQYSRLPPLSTFERFTHPLQRPRKRFGNSDLTLAAPQKNMTPYMQMSFAPLERRLDMALFRAMFASSVRQARQFIIHGAVEVNGKKMVYPAYQLNPGDMFQVQVEKVLYGTGKQAPKRLSKETPDSEADKARKLRNRVQSRSAKWNKTHQDPEKERPLEQFSEELRQYKLHPKFKEIEGLTNAPHTILRKIRQLEERVKEEGKLDLAGSEMLEDIRERVRKALGDLPEDTKLESMFEDFKLLLASRDALFDELVEETPEDGIALTEKATETAASTPPTEENAEDAAAPKQDNRVAKVASTLTKAQAARFKAALENDQFKLSNEAMRNLANFIRQDEENPYDPSKPYLTPWQPRDYMSAFAFIPRYLEVNHDICAAVYLRHPVARKGIAEVPTPFSYLTNQLAHNWYLQRGPRQRS